MLANKLIESAGAGTTYVDDVFSTYLYTGNGSTQTITNGIDLAGKGGMVWIKNLPGFGTPHALWDTARGISKYLATDSTAGQGTTTAGADITSFQSNGFALGTNEQTNASPSKYASWTFSESQKFFDIVSYTGNGTTQAINHALGIAPGMVIIKRLDATGGAWKVWHRSATSGNYLVLNTTAAQTTTSAVNNFGNNTITVDPTSTQFTVGSNADVNANTVAYVAYLFAHDPSADGIIQCGSFTTDGSGNATVNLGWEPQYVLRKIANSTGGNWVVNDQMRGMTADGNGQQLNPNTAGAELASYSSEPRPNATGFTYVSPGETSKQFIYLAIRRPNKPPTSGTSVYNAIARTGTGAAATVTGVGFAPDMFLPGSRQALALGGTQWFDRLRGTPALKSSGTAAEYTTGTDGFLGYTMDGVSLGTDASNNELNFSSRTYINWFFRRAPGVFDVVCDTGTGVAHTISHNLGVIPELMIRKGRSGATQWEVYCAYLANTEKLVLNTTAGKATDTAAWNSTSPTASAFTVGTGANVNTNNATYVTYLFATLPGVSKVGSYTGNGSSQTINCGFGAGARFVLIKRTGSTGGDWYVWDTARGIATTNDPHLSLNTTAAEVTTDDSVDPDSTGFIVNQLAATNINVSSATYIYLAIA